MTRYSEYMESIKEEIHECISTMECLPILFIGSGLPKRYFDAPNWDQLLDILSDVNPKAKPIAYYRQNFKDNTEIGSELARVYNDWAWDVGEPEFDKLLFEGTNKHDIFIKSKIAEKLHEITPKSIDEVKEDYKSEVESLMSISPHAIITTNYDEFLEKIFSDYEPIIGQKILRAQYQSIGEIFKIHGCVSEFSDIILTKEDYDEFQIKKKYLTAKLLTYFIEHPIFIFGYSLSDINIQAILSDIDEILVSNGELVPNIYLVDWKEDINPDASYRTESLVQLDNGKSLRIKTIVANNFKWIFDALSIDVPLENVNPKLLRALLSRTYELVRTDVPRKTIEIDYQGLKTALEDKSEVGKIYGITTLSNPSAFSVSYPYSLKEVANELGYTNWHPANKLLEKIKDDDNICIKESDNAYHIAVINGGNVVTRKYSENMIELLRKVRDGEAYKIEL